MPEWPGADRRRPRPGSPTWTVRAPLAEWLRRAAVEAAGTYGRYRVLDVGSGIKPYYPFFEPYADEYVGVDLGPDADLQGTVESLPVENGSFDLVLCTQVLEHCDDPAKAVSELRRVTRPGGRVLASTHGVSVYHPAPQDLWRWTHSGLDRLFRENAEWSAVTVRPGSGTTACVGMLLSHSIDLLLKRARLRPLGRPLIAGINRGAAALDRSVPMLGEPIAGSLAANYHVEAVV
ncbi:MAG: class I SAM-dependent methyltransferase [Gaiellaceae bacterium]